MWHLGRLDWIVEDRGGVSGSDERRFDGNTGVEEDDRSRFTVAKDLGGLNLDACRSGVRGRTDAFNGTDLGRTSGRTWRRGWS